MIDAVITWVDASDPEYVSRRKHHSDPTCDGNAGDNASLRWENNDEVSICIKSMELYAPWIRNIWIVTDRQTPNISGVSPRFREKIAVVHHDTIFREYSDILPVFNSLSIETLLFRIPGLASKFIYFNDDFFLLRRTEPLDFFLADGTPVLRGRWIKGRELTRSGALTPHRGYQLRAASMVQPLESEVFLPAHVANSFCRDTLEMLFQNFRVEFERNLAFRYRDSSQFNISSLFAAHKIVNQGAEPLLRKDFAQVSAGTCQSGSLRKINSRLRRLKSPRIKLGCINDVGALRRRFPGLYEHFREIFSDSTANRFWARRTLGWRFRY